MSKAKIRRNSINMYNAADSTAGVALDSTTGTTSASNSSYTSDYIAIDRTKNYTVTIASSSGTVAEDVNRGLCFYDSNKTYISGFAWRGRTDTSYSAPLRSTNIPSGTAYIRFTCDNGVSTVMLAPGLTAVPYEPYGEVVWGDCASKSRIMSRNLFDKTACDSRTNVYLQSDGTIYQGSSSVTNAWTISDYIPITPDVPTYTACGLSRGGNGTYCCVYDSNKTFLRSVLMIANQNVTINTQAGDAYVRLSVRMVNNEIATAMFNEGAAMAYEPYGEGVWADCAVKRRIMSRNLFDYTTMVGSWNGYINANNVSYGASDWRTTDYIPCDGTDFVLSKVGGNTPAICAYDENKRLITGKAYNSGGSATKIDVFLHTSATAKFIRFSYYGDSTSPSSYIDPSTLMLSEGTTVLPTEPYGEEIWV